MMKKINKYYQYFIFLLITIIITWPIIINFNKGIFAVPGDPFGNLWWIWWNKYALLNKLNPDFVNIVNYPNGLWLDNNSLSISQIIAKYIGFISNEIFAYNFVIFLNIFLAGVSIYLLVNYLTRNRIASIYSGIIYMASPYLLSKSLNHLELSGIFWFPLIILYLLKLNKKTNLKNICLCGLFIAGAIIQSFYYGYMIGVILLYFGLFFFIKKIINKDNPFKFILILILTVIIGIIFSLPLTINIIKTINKNGNSELQIYQRSHDQLKYYSAKLGYYLLPFKGNYLIGKFNTIKFDDEINNFVEKTLYIGWVPIILAIILIFICFNKKINIENNQKILILFFILLCIFGYIYSFSPYIKIGSFKIRAPSDYVYNFLPYFRVFSRFGIIVIFSITVLAGIALSILLKYIKNKKINLIILLILLISIIIEFNSFSMNKYIDLQNKSIPEIYKYLKNLEKGLLVEYPFLPSDSPGGYSYYLWQRYHQMPLVYGAKVNSDDEKFRKVIIDPTNPDTIKKLKEINVKYIIIHSSDYVNSPHIKQFPQELNNGEILVINSDKLELIKEFNGDRLYKIK